MRFVCPMLLLIAASCARDNPRYFDGQASTGASEDATGVEATTDTMGGTDGDGTTSSTSTAGTNGSSSSGGVSVSPHCEGDAVLVEPFGAVPTENDDWWVSNPETLEISSTNDALLVEFDGNPGYWVMGSRSVLPAQGSLGFEVLKEPSAAHPIQVLVSLNDGDRLLQFALALGYLDISWWDQVLGQATSATMSEPIVFDPIEHRWLRMSFDTQTRQATGAVSSDGFEWTTVFSADISLLALDQTQVQFSIGAWGGFTGTDSALIDNAFMCVE